ncbi:MAG: hypothetical protein ACRELF_25415, partial [Gemmataceae bacterium]
MKRPIVCILHPIHPIIPFGKIGAKAKEEKDGGRGRDELAPGAIALACPGYDVGFAVSDASQKRGLSLTASFLAVGVDNRGMHSCK